MIDRYSRQEMTQIWSQQSRFSYMLEVEKAAAKAQAELKMIPVNAAKQIEKLGKFSVSEIQEIEKTTRHDVIAFVTNVARYVGESGKYVHFGLTSSDVLDTALSLQIRGAGQVLCASLARLKKSLSTLVKHHARTVCVGRTHGMFAEPTTFGFKMAGFLAELDRNEKRIIQALDQACIIKMSGAVGTFSAIPPQLQKKVGQRLGLKSESIATQVIPRDRMAEVMWALACLGAGFERLGVELRHLQRTEVGEVVEGFKPGQKGSSAMPHKKNPISGENITGLARLLRSYVVPALENVALWHERDISHSSVERVVLPDAFIVADYAADRLAEVLKGLHVDTERMKKNLQLGQGQIFSSHFLNALVAKGLTREQAYAIVQQASFSLEINQTLGEKLVAQGHLNKKHINEIVSAKKYVEAASKAVKDWMKE